MDQFEEKLANFCRKENLFFEPLYFSESTHTVAEAAKAAKCAESDLVKNICLLDKSGSLVVAIIRGDSRLDRKKLEQAAGSKLSFCTADDVLEKTGYPAGGVPSIDLSGKGRVFVDELVAQKEFVLCGGGSARSLARVRARDVINANRASVLDVAQA